MHSPRAIALIVAAGFVLGASLAPCQLPTCPSQGPTMSMIGGRLGDAWSLSLSGPPGAPALIATDPAPGPVITGVGPVCLGLSGGLVTAPVMLDATGSFSIGGVLPLTGAFPAGATLSVQAAVAHPSYPSGLGLTNGSTVTFRQPGLGAFTQSVSTPTGVNWGNFTIIDGLTNAVVATVPTPVISPGFVQRIPRLGWFAFLTFGGVMFVDDASGVIALSLPGALPGCTCYLGPGYLTAMTPSADGTRFVTAWGGGVPLYVNEYSLPSGALVSAASFTPTNWSGGGYLIPISGTSLTYVAYSSTIQVIDGSSGALGQSIALPGTLTWSPLLSGNLLYASTSAGLVAIDVTTHVIVAGPAPVGPANAALVASGPGPNGQSLYVFGGNLLIGYTLSAVDTASGAVASVPLSGTLGRMLLTAGATEWLLEVFDPLSANFQLCVMNPATMQITVILPSVVNMTTVVLRSDTLRKAYMQSGPNMVALSTDPVSPPGTPLPTAGQFYSN